jgi:hypothetical protein
MKSDLHGPLQNLLIDGYPLAGCALLLAYLLSCLIF